MITATSCLHYNDAGIAGEGGRINKSRVDVSYQLNSNKLVWRWVNRESLKMVFEKTMTCPSVRSLALARARAATA